MMDITQFVTKTLTCGFFVGSMLFVLAWLLGSVSTIMLTMFKKIIK